MSSQGIALIIPYERNLKRHLSQAGGSFSTWRVPIRSKAKLQTSSESTPLTKHWPQMSTGEAYWTKLRRLNRPTSPTLIRDQALATKVTSVSSVLDRGGTMLHFRAQANSSQTIPESKGSQVLKDQTTKIDKVPSPSQESRARTQSVEKIDRSITNHIQKTLTLYCPLKIRTRTQRNKWSMKVNKYTVAKEISIKIHLQNKIIKTTK